jgi:hypothetical protein
MSEEEVTNDSDNEVVSVNIKIPKNAILVGVAVLCKYMDEDGSIHYTEGGDKAISTVETLGMVTAYADVLKSKLNKPNRS